ncbi:aldose 1-epimerase family protein [Paucilactobacillus sp. N302-9]
MITIDNEQLTAEFTTLGAQLTSLKKKTDSFEYIWQGDPVFWKYQAPVLFPFVGRLKDDQYQYQDKTYSQTQHGFARQSEFQVVSQSQNKVQFELRADETTKEVYPFDFLLTITYSLDGNRLLVSYTVKNMDNTELLYALGAHPGFNISIQHGAVLDVQPAQEYEQIPLVGPYNDIEHLKTINLTKPLSLERTLFKNDAIILNLKMQSTKLSLKDNQNHLVSVNLTQTPFVGVWTPFDKEAPFVCLEPWWGIADSVTSNYQLTQKTAINHLAVHQSQQMGFEIEIG